MSAGRACRPLPAAWRSAQHVHPEKSPSDLRPRPHPFGPLLVTFTSGRPVLRRPRSTRSSAGAFWPMAAPHPSSVLAPPSPWRRRQPCRRRRASPCARCRTGGDGLHQVLTDLAPVWPPRPRAPPAAHQRHRPLHVLAGVLALAAAARALVAVSTIISSVSSWAVVHAPGRAGGAGKRG